MKKILRGIFIAAVGGVIVMFVQQVLFEKEPMSNINNQAEINISSSSNNGTTISNNININNTSVATSNGGVAISNGNSSNSTIAINSQNLQNEYEELNSLSDAVARSFEQNTDVIVPHAKPNKQSFTSDKENTVVDKPLLDSLSFDAFLRQMNMFSADSGKVRYIEKNKELLREKVSFSELIMIIDDLSADSNKLKAVKSLRVYLESPSEIELDIYLSKFSADSNKKRALDIVYAE